jgi:ribosomal protein S27E
MQSQKQKINKDVKIKCENCGSHYGYFKLKTNSYQCRSCGHITVRRIE